MALKDDFIAGSKDRFAEDTTGSKYEELVQDNSKIEAVNSALFDEEALDPYEVNNAKD